MSTQAIVPQEQSEFNVLQAQYQREINPQGPLQQTLFEELVAAAWNLRRVHLLEAEIDMLDPRFDRLARHHARFEKTFHRALKELRTLQTEAALRQLLPPETRRNTPVLACPEKIAKGSQQRDKLRSGLLQHLQPRKFYGPPAPAPSDPNP